MFSQMLVLLASGIQADTSREVAWEWDRETPICSLRQQTSPSGETTELSRTPGNEETEIKVTLQASSQIREGHFRGAALRLDSGGEAIAEVLAGTDNKSPPDVYAVTQDPAFTPLLSKASALEISHDKIGTLRVAFRSAATAIEALRRCEDFKMRQWGIDPVAWRGLKSRPVPLKPVRDRFNALDYPREALAASVETDAIILLDVGSDGRVRKCASLNPGEYRGFEHASCDVLRGAKFQPAQDAAGNPTSAPYVFDVRFRIDQ